METDVKIIPKGLHAAEHEVGGIDVIDVTDLVGVLANPQPAIAHQASHITGADLLDLNGQSFENLLINGDFEVGDPPIHWVLNGAAATLARSNAQAIINDYSALLTRNGTDCSLRQLVPDPTRYQARAVTLGCWIYATVANRVRLAMADGVNPWAYSDYHTGGGDWEWITFTVVPDATTVGITISLAVDTGDTAAYFDGATLVEGELCPAFSPKPPAVVVEETQVYAAAAPVAWTDLDISALLGIEIGSALVMLKMTETSNTANTNFAVRRNGDTDVISMGGAYNVGGSVATQNSAGWAVVMCFTDENGVIEWIANAANTLTIDVMGYIKC